MSKVYCKVCWEREATHTSTIHWEEVFNGTEWVREYLDVCQGCDATNPIDKHISELELATIRLNNIGRWDR